MSDLEVRLNFPCPGRKCDKQLNVNWVHKDCGGQSMINMQGDIWCAIHPSNKSFIKQWRFNCKKETHEGEEYVSWTDSGDLIIAIGIAAKCAENASQYKALKLIVENIMLRWKD